MMYALSLIVTVLIICTHTYIISSLDENLYTHEFFMVLVTEYICLEIKMVFPTYKALIRSKELVLASSLVFWTLVYLMKLSK